MLSSLLISGLILQAASAQAGAARAPAEWVILVAAPVYQPDGAISAETVALPATGAGLVHLFGRRSVCDPAVTGAAEPADGGFGWRVASQVVSRTEREIVVSIDWRRLWDDGRKTKNGPGGTVQLTLHPGDRIPLDHIANTKPRPDCRAVGLGLEVRLGQAAAPGLATSATLPLGATPGGSKPVNAELWLLHTLPSGVEQVVHQTVRVPAAGGRFSFAPSSVSTSRGDLGVELTGSINRYTTPTGTEFLLLSLTRTVRGEGLPPTGVSGTTGSVVPLPVPTDVLSFEMPGGGRARAGGGGGGGARGGGGGGGAGGAMGAAPPNVAGSGGAGGAAAVQAGARGGRGGGNEAAARLAVVSSLLEGHQFALRMRITPVPVS